jgi:hypothetical protein
MYVTWIDEFIKEHAKDFDAQIEKTIAQLDK